MSARVAGTVQAVSRCRERFRLPSHHGVRAGCHHHRHDHRCDGRRAAWRVTVTAVNDASGNTYESGDRREGRVPHACAYRELQDDCGPGRLSPTPPACGCRLAVGQTVTINLQLATVRRAVSP